MSITNTSNPAGSWAHLRQTEDEALERMRHVRQAWLDAQVQKTNTWYDYLGPAGSAFRQAFQAAACSETIDTVRPSLAANTRAVMNAHHIFSGFQNNVLIGEAALEDSNPFALFSALNHERTHLAIQYRNVAATHATPWNSYAHVVLCPRDAMIINVLMERQAFAVQRVFEEMIMGVKDGKIGPANMPSSADLQAALQAYARTIDTQVKWDTDADFVRHYRDQAQGFYTGGHAKYLKGADITYARLGIEDLRAINDFLGLKTFGETDAELLALLKEPFEDYQLKTVEEQNANLGVPAYDRLPSVTSALADRGLSPEGFIRVSLGKFAPALPPKKMTADPAPEFT